MLGTRRIVARYTRSIFGSYRQNVQNVCRGSQREGSGQSHAKLIHLIENRFWNADGVCHVVVLLKNASHDLREKLCLHHDVLKACSFFDEREDPHDIGSGVHRHRSTLKIAEQRSIGLPIEECLNGLL